MEKFSEAQRVAIRRQLWQDAKVSEHRTSIADLGAISYKYQRFCDSLFHSLSGSGGLSGLICLARSGFLKRFGTNLMLLSQTRHAPMNQWEGGGLSLSNTSSLSTGSSDSREIAMTRCFLNGL